MTAVRYIGPLEGKRRLDRGYGLVTQVEADNGRLVGIGESIVAAKDVDSAWTTLECLAQHLAEAQLPRRLRPDHPLGQISDGSTSHGKRDAGSRAARLALELAVLDLGMKSSNTGPDQFFGTDQVEQAPLMRLPRRQPEAFLRDLAAQQRTGDLPIHVVVEFGPNDRPDEELTYLQAVTHGVSGNDHRISLVARADRYVPSVLERFGHLDGISLSPSRMGGVFAVLDAAAQARSHRSTMTVVLAGSGRGSDITKTALTSLAAATGAFDVWADPVPTGEWPTQLMSPRRSGLFGSLDLAALGIVADRIIEAPPVADPDGRTPNDFSVEITSLTPRGVPKQTLLEIEALKAGLSTRRYGPQLFLADHDELDTPIGFSGPQSSLTSVAASTIARNKGLTRSVLSANGLPVARGGWFPADATEKISAAAAEIGFPLVVKPADGLKGYAVTTGIRSASELEAALKRVTTSSFGSAGIILESMVAGHDYRVLATPSKVLSVVRRDPAYVVGNARNTVGELVLRANIGRQKNPYLGRHLMRPDEHTRKLLRDQGHDFDSIPSAGEIVRIAQVANLSQGGISTELIDSAHPSLHELAICAVSAVPGLPYGGIDIFMEDHARPVDEQDVTIIEINHNPALMLHPYPMFGSPTNVFRELLSEFAGMQGHELGAARDILTVRLSVAGRVQRVGYRRWMAGAAHQLELDGWVRNEEGSDRVQAVVHGRAERVAVMIRLASSGPSHAKPAETFIEPIDATPRPGFVILRDGEEPADV